MNAGMNRQQALELLKTYNQEPFHLQHAYTVEGVMRWYAQALGYGEDADFWATVGLLHDIDFERWPEEHCQKAPQLLSQANADKALIHAVCSHAYGLMSDVEPEHEMEIGAAALMRPSKSVADMEVSSLKKKFKDKRFAAGCSREVIVEGAQRLGWDLNDLFDKTLQAMRACEQDVAEQMAT